MSALNDTTTELQGLLDRATDGDESAYGDLVDRSSERLGRLAKKMLRSYPRVRRWEMTDDVLQAAMLRLHQSLSSARPVTVRQYFGLANRQIHRTLVDLARHYYGVYGLGANHNTDGGTISGHAVDRMARLASDNTVPSNMLEWTAFHEAIETLPSDEREAFELVWYSGQTVRDTAEVLSVSLSTVVRRLNRARRMLYDKMHGEQPETDA
ncbi:MAG: RNA polymerase sigma factor [Pseudomonadota bacterium]